MADANCVFCKIISGDVLSNILFEDDKIIVFNDKNPASRHHLLVIPKIHVINVNHLKSPEDIILVEHMVEIGTKVLENKGGDIIDTILGFHCPPNSVDHLHLHVIYPVSEMDYISKAIYKPNSWWFQTAADTIKKLKEL